MLFKATVSEIKKYKEANLQDAAKLVSEDCLKQRKSMKEHQPYSS